MFPLRYLNNSNREEEVNWFCVPFEGKQETMGDNYKDLDFSWYKDSLLNNQIY